jgi:hypothetical protein
LRALLGGDEGSDADLQAEATLVLLMEKQLAERRAQTAALRR